VSPARTVLVTGAAGFVGQRVVAALADRSVEVVRVDHAWGSAGELASVLGDRAVDAAIHLGWYAHPADYLTAVGPNLRSLDASLELVELLGRRSCSTLVVAGSSAEYGPSSRPLGEDDPIEPWSVYGAAKASLRLLLASSLRPPAMQVTWARLFNVTGPGEHPDRLVPTVVRSLAAGDPIDLSPGEQQRDFLDVDDVADALVHLAAAGVRGPVNVCSGSGITLRSLLDQVADRVGDRSLLRFGARDYGAHDPMRVVGDPGRLRATGWTPSYSTTDMIDRVVAAWLDAPTRKAPTAS
jgi:nucleoside-diphosphate-sugar epimerase